MNHLPPVSIFIVTYLSSEERGEVLKRTCEAALAQRYPDFEVVVSENPGPVHARDALASINDPRLKIVRSDENEGFTGNTNRCIKLCSHDIIKLVCDDDLMHPDFLMQTVPLVNDETMVTVGVQKYYIGKEPEEFHQELHDPLPTQVRSPGYETAVWSLPYSASCIPSATLFTRNLFSELGGFDFKTVTSDWDFFIEVCLNRRIVNISHPMCYVGVWEGSLTEEMEDKPFFFPREGLYTKFRVLHDKAISTQDRRELKKLLARELLFNRLRCLKRWHQKTCRTSFRDYASQYAALQLGGENKFTPRPCGLAKV